MLVTLHTYFRVTAFMYAGSVCRMSFYDNIIIVVRTVARTYKDEVFCQFVFLALGVYAYGVDCEPLATWRNVSNMGGIHIW